MFLRKLLGVSNLYKCVLPHMFERLSLKHAAAVLLVAGTASSSFGQSATLTLPTTGGLNIDNVPVSWSISDPTGALQNIQLSWTVTDTNSVYLSNTWVLVIVSTNLSGTFTFNPSTVLSSTNIQSVTPATAMPDTTWSVFLSYQRAASAGGGIVMSAAKTSVRTDTQTLPATIFSPTNGVTYGNPVPIQYSVPELVALHSARLTFTGPTTNILFMNTLRNVAFLLNTTNIASSSANITSVTANALVDGTYAVTYAYRDNSGHPAVTSAVKTFSLDTVTLSPSLIQPTANTQQSSISVQYQIPEQPLANSVTLSYVGPQTGSFQLPDSLGTNLSYGPITSLVDGAYSFTLSYQDAVGNPAASITVTNVYLDTTTEAPTLTAPTSYFTTRDNLPISYALPETPLGGTLLLVFQSTQTIATLTMNNSAVNNFTWDVHTDPMLIPSVVAASTNSLPDGNYTVSVRYQDSYANPVASAQASNIVIVTATIPPSLTQPNNNSTYNILPISYTLPVTPLAGSVKLAVSGPTNVIFTMVDVTLVSTVFVDPHAPVTNVYPFVSADIPLEKFPDGAYAVEISYQDYLGNPAASAWVTNVLIDTTTLAPTLLTPTNNFSTAQFIPVSYGLPEVPQPGSVVLTFSNALTLATFTMNNATFNSFNWDVHTDPALIPAVVSASTSSLPDGIYEVSVRYQDSLGNPSASALATNVVIDSLTLAPTLVEPTNGMSAVDVLPVTYTLPEVASPGSVRLTLASTSLVATLYLADATNQSFSWNVHQDPTLLPEVVTSSVSFLPNNEYVVTLRYQDALGNSAASSDPVTVHVETVTSPPLLISPTNNFATRDILPVSYVLPETPQPGSVVLSFTNAQAFATFTMNNATSNSFNWNVHTDPSLIPAVVSASTSSLPDGSYLVTLEYQNDVRRPRRGRLRNEYRH